MTSSTRILAAFKGEVPDRVPIWAWGIHPWLKNLHPSVQPVVDAYLEKGDIIHWWSPGAGHFLTDSGCLSVKTETNPSSHPGYEEQVTTFGTPAGALTQITYRSLEGKPGYAKKHLLETEADVERLLSIPYVPPRPDCSCFFELQRELSDRGRVMTSVGSDPMYSLNRLTGSETFAVWSVERRDLIEELIGVFLRRTKDWIEWVLSQGVGPLFGYVGPELCIPPLQSPRDFEAWVVPPDGEINDLIHSKGGLALVHCHGRMGPVLEGFVRMRADVIHPIEPPPMGDVVLSEAKRRVGEDLCIAGNIQHHDICTMPNRRFRDLVEETVLVGKAGGGFILSPTATPFGWPDMTDLERDNWLSLLEVGLGAGRA